MSQRFEEQRSNFFSEVPQILSENYRQPWSTCMRYGTQDVRKIASLCNNAAQSMTSAVSTMAGRLAHGEPLDNICASEMLPYYKKQSFPSTAVGGKASAIADMMVLVASVHPDQFSQYAGGGIHKDIVLHLNGTLHSWLLELQKQWQTIRREIRADRTIFDVPIPPPEREKATLGTMFGALGEALCIGRPRPSPFLDEGAKLFAERFNVKLWPVSDAAESSSQRFKCVAAELSTQFQEWYFTVGKTNINAQNPNEYRLAEDAFVRMRDFLHHNARQCTASTNETACAGECMGEFYSYKAREDERFTQVCRSTIQIMHRRLQQPKTTIH